MQMSFDVLTTGRADEWTGDFAGSPQLTPGGGGNNLGPSRRFGERVRYVPVEQTDPGRQAQVAAGEPSFVEAREARGACVAARLRPGPGTGRRRPAGSGLSGTRRPDNR
ncbi:MAG TPA: hypothetical protein VNS49_00165 [Streptomyces sp.]|nr:hypothetical protein [Streptomyces sp.]